MLEVPVTAEEVRWLTARAKLQAMDTLSEWGGELKVWSVGADGTLIVAVTLPDSPTQDLVRALLAVLSLRAVDVRFEPLTESELRELEAFPNVRGAAGPRPYCPRCGGPDGHHHDSCPQRDRGKAKP